MRHPDSTLAVPHRQDAFQVRGVGFPAHPRPMPKAPSLGHNGQDESPHGSGPAMEQAGLLTVTASSHGNPAATHPDALSARALPSQEHLARATSPWLAVAFPHRARASGPSILNVDRTAPFTLPIQTYPMAAYFLRNIHPPPGRSIAGFRCETAATYRRRAANVARAVSFSPDAGPSLKSSRTRRMGWSLR